MNTNLNTIAKIAGLPICHAENSFYVYLVYAIVPYSIKPTPLLKASIMASLEIGSLSRIFQQSMFDLQEAKANHKPSPIFEHPQDVTLW